MNIMLYSMITLYNSYIPLKLSFLGEARKGLLLTVSPAVSLLAPLLWGVLADRMTYREKAAFRTVYFKFRFLSGYLY